MVSDCVIDQMARFRRKSFVQIFHRTMTALFPLILAGCFSWLIYANLLSTDGFLGSVLHVNSWLPFRRFFRALFSDVTRVTIGWSAPFAALVSAIITTKYYQRENPIAGATAIVCYTMIFVHGVRGNNGVIEMRYYNAAWFLIGIIVGYLVGRVFVKYGRPATFMDFTTPNSEVLKRVLSNLKPFVMITVGAFILHLLFALYRQFGLDGMVTQWIGSLLDRNSNYFVNIILSFLNTILVWLGFAEPLNVTSQVYNNEMAANLGYALSHKTPWGIPYPFTPSALYSGFAVFGGVGITLALIIAILWVTRYQNTRCVANYSMIPGFFNIGLPILFGAQVFWNPAFLLPFIFLPIFNILIASVLIFIHAMPPLVYPVPNGTPGILIPFIATGGNWMAFIITILLLVMDVVLYIPFVKLAEKVEHRSDELAKEERQNETNQKAS